MPTTLNNTQIVFNNGTTQDSAAATISSSTAFDGIGSYAVLVIAVNTNLAIGATIAGSSLRYNNSVGAGPLTLSGNPFSAGYARQGSSVYAGGGTALSGTWRRMSGGTTYHADTYNGNYSWGYSLYVRIS